MSTATLGNAATLHERTLDATKRLCQVLGLDFTSSTQIKYLTIALAEVASDEAAYNTHFVNHIKEKLAEILPAQKKQSIPPKKLPNKNKLTPIKQVDGLRLIRNGIPDAFVLLEAYGHEQFADVLNQYSLGLLKKMASEFEQNYPGTHPKNKNQKGTIVDYIMQAVTKSP